MEFLFSSDDVDMVFILFNDCHIDLGYSKSVCNMDGYLMLEKIDQAINENFFLLCFIFFQIKQIIQ